MSWPPWKNSTARPHQAVEFFHGGHDIRHVFDRVNGQQPVEAIVSKRVRKAVQIAKDVGAARGIPVDPDGSGLFVNPAADVQYSQSSRIGRAGHSSRISDAKSRLSRAMSKAGDRIPMIAAIWCI